MFTPQKQIEMLELKENYSIYSYFSDKKLFGEIINGMSHPFQHQGIDKVLGLEARGFILGGAIAYKLKAGFVVARKKGRMYSDDYNEEDVYSETSVDYSGTEKTLEIEKNEKGLTMGDKVLIVDDWFETGGQGHMAIKLAKKASAKVVGISIILDDMNMEVRNSFKKYNLKSLVVKENFIKIESKYVLKQG